MTEVNSFSWDEEGFEFIESKSEESKENLTFDMSVFGDESEEENNDSESEIENKEGEEANEENLNLVIDDEEEKDGESDENNKSSLKEFTESLKEFGLFSEDEEIGEDFDQVKLIERIDETIDTKVSEALDSYADDLGNDGKQLIKFLKEGGTISQFLNTYQKEAALPVQSVDSEEDQEKFLRFYLTNEEGMTAEEAKETVDDLKDLGKLDKNAERYFSLYSRKVEKERQTILERQEEYKRTQEEQSREFKKNVVEVINNTSDLNGFKLNQKNKDSLLNFITRPTVKTESGYVSQLQVKMSEALSDPKKLVIMAKLLQSDFDFSDITKTVESKVSNKVKDGLNNMRKTKSNYKDKLNEYFSS